MVPAERSIPGEAAAGSDLELDIAPDPDVEVRERFGVEEPMRSTTRRSVRGIGSGSAKARVDQSKRRKVLGRSARKGSRTSVTRRARSTPSQSVER